MRRLVILKMCLMISLAFGVLLMPENRLTAFADEVAATVEGTVMSGTTAEILKLSTKEGDMEIKLPDSKIKVSVSHGSDGYLHAV